MFAHAIIEVQTPLGGKMHAAVVVRVDRLKTLAVLPSAQNAYPTRTKPFALPTASWVRSANMNIRHIHIVLIARIDLPSSPFRLRDKEHCKFVASQPCIVCGRTPCEAHHIRFAQRRALSRKVSDEFTVPVCRLHHRELHIYGDEASWWAGVSIDPLPIALELW